MSPILIEGQLSPGLIVLQPGCLIETGADAQHGFQRFQSRTSNLVGIEIAGGQILALQIKASGPQPRQKVMRLLKRPDIRLAKGDNDWPSVLRLNRLDAYGNQNETVKNQSKE